PALACGGLVSPNGTIQLVRTTTMAAYHNGLEHYVTSFEFAGGGAKFGAIMPLPATPRQIVHGGDWTLQRLEIEVQPQSDAGGFSGRTTAATPAPRAELTEEDVYS